jgi:hypothetical protein
MRTRGNEPDTWVKQKRHGKTTEKAAGLSKDRRETRHLMGESHLYSQKQRNNKFGN